MQQAKSIGTHKPQAPQAAKLSDIKPNEVIDRTVPIIDEQGVTFTPAQFDKNNSLLVLAYQSDIRADFVVMTARPFLSTEQCNLAKQMALTYENQFQDLARQRATILASATNDNDVDRRILKVQMKLASLLRQIRMRINIEIMTPAQREESRQVYLVKMAENATKAEADKKKRAGQAKPVDN